MTGNRVTHSLDDDCVPPHAAPGERWVSVMDDGDLWPAAVDLTDRWNGWLSPLFRPSVARKLARWQAAWLERIADEPFGDAEQDQLVLSPDGRTIAHLTADEDVVGSIAPPVGGQVHGDPVIDTTGWPESWFVTRAHSVWLVYDLSDSVAIGAWFWTWHLAEPPTEATS